MVGGSDAPVPEFHLARRISLVSVTERRSHRALPAIWFEVECSAAATIAWPSIAPARRRTRRGRRRKAKGRRVYQIEAHTGRVTEWLFTEGLLDLPDNTEASRTQIEEALTRYIGQK